MLVIFQATDDATKPSLKISHIGMKIKWRSKQKIRMKSKIHSEPAYFPTRKLFLTFRINTMVHSFAVGTKVTREFFVNTSSQREHNTLYVFLL